MTEADACWLAAAVLQQRPASYRLSPEEAERAAALPAQRAEQFLTGRWLLRELLTEIHPGHSNTGWDITAPLDGPPQLRGSLRPATSLSVSHSQHQVLVAVSAQDVGVDIEVPARGRYRAALAAAVCPELPPLAEATAWPEAQLFHALWTQKEAWLKRRGQGVSPGRLQALRGRRARPEDLLVARTWCSATACLSVVSSATLPVHWSARYTGPEPLINMGMWALDDLGVDAP